MSEVLAGFAVLSQQEDDFLERFAERVARHITADTLRPLIREMVILRELEVQNVRRDGLTRSLLRVLFDAGIRLRTDDKGGLTVGPKEKITPYWTDIINAYRFELIRELNVSPQFKASPEKKNEQQPSRNGAEVKH